MFALVECACVTLLSVYYMFYTVKMFILNVWKVRRGRKGHF